MEKKKIITEIQEKRCRMIGIAGSNTGVGCTHFSIMLTNYLAGYLRRKAILLEFNEYQIKLLEVSDVLFSPYD